MNSLIFYCLCVIPHIYQQGASPRKQFGKVTGGVASDSRVNIAILSHCTYQNYFCYISRCNHERYASKYNYTYINPRVDSDEFHLSKFLLHGTRYKTYSIIRQLKLFRWILWIDSDALFVNLNLPIEHWISKAQKKNSNIIVARDIPGYPFNAGVMLVRSNWWTKNFFIRAIPEIIKRQITHSSQDQPVFFKFLKENKYNEQNKILILKQRSQFQAFIKMKEFSKASWIVHLTCCKGQQCDMTLYDSKCAANCTRSNCLAQSVGKC